MKIKRFVATDMRKAMRKVREEQGPDAVILSSQSIDGGVEVIAAIDYDAGLARDALANAGPARDRRSGAFAPETLHPPRDATAPEPAAPQAQQQKPVAPGARAQIPDAHTPAARTGKTEDSLNGMRREVESMRRLLEAQLASLAWNDLARRRPDHAFALREMSRVGLAPSLAREIADEIDWDAADAPAPDDMTDILAGRIAICDEEVIETGGAIAVVGPTGVGKTTTIAKLAARFVLRHGNDQLALITTDHFRIGAHEQLMTFARILDVPVRCVSDSEELRAALDDLAGRKLILIDTAGMSQRDLRLTDQFAVLEPNGERIRVLLTLSAQTQLGSLDEVARRFSHLRPVACLLTKVDEAASLGPALSTLIRHGLPLAYTTDGQKVPEDIQATAGSTAALLQLATQRADESAADASEAELAQTFGGALAHA